MQDSIPQTLTEYIVRNHADDWSILPEPDRLSIAALEVVDGCSHNLDDATSWAVLTAGRGDAIAGYTAMGYGISPALLSDAVRYRAELWLKDDQNDCLRARGDRQWHYMCSVHNRAMALLQDDKSMAERALEMMRRAIVVEDHERVEYSISSGAGLPEGFIRCPGCGYYVEPEGGLDAQGLYSECPLCECRELD